MVVLQLSLLIVPTPSPSVSSSEESAVPEEGKGGVARLERPKKCFLHKKPRPHTCPKCRKYAEEMEVFTKGLIEMAGSST